ncbi:MAG: DUF5694 domain-containing protein [Pseudomonadota bacterium]
MMKPVLRYLGAFVAGLSVFLAANISAYAAEPVQDDNPVQVMILGTYHFANPGQDVVNMEVDDVRTPKRQEELELLTKALAQWQPDRILVESQRSAPDFKDEKYTQFTAANLTENRNEIVQIGYRLASKMGHKAVYGFDEQPSAGEPDYFPMGKVMAFAQANAMDGIIQGLIGQVREKSAEQQSKQATQTIAESLLEHNDPGEIYPMHRALYYGLLQFGDGDDQPGAELNAYWYMRNAKMFGKLQLIAEPGERIFVLVGSGHAYWLRHFVEETPGYVLTEPTPYLRAAIVADKAVKGEGKAE